MKIHYQTHLIGLGLYLLLALFLTWPLSGHLTSHIPGEATWAFDESTFVWNMWWFKFSALNLRQTPLASTHIFFPLGIHLTTYTFNLFNAAFGLPLQLALSLPLANNLTLLFSYLSSAYGAFLLSLYLLYQPEQFRWNKGDKSKIYNLQSKIPELAAFAAGAVFAFSASRMMYVALGHYNFVTIQWFPFYTLFLLKALRGRTFKNIFLAALFAAFCLYAELTYSVFLLFITLFILANEWRRQRNDELGTMNDELIQGKSHPIGLAGSSHWSGRFVTLAQQVHCSSFIISLFLIPFITFLLTAPFILSVLPDFLDPAYAEPGWGEGLKLSADLVGLVTLTPLHPLSGLDWLTELRQVVEGASRFSDANTLFLGYGIVAFALLGFIARPRVAGLWFWSALCFGLFSLGPLLTINGQNRFQLDGLEVTFPLPFMLLHYIPILNANRVPNRFGIPLTLSLAILAGYGIAWLLYNYQLVINNYQKQKKVPHTRAKPPCGTQHHAPERSLPVGRTTHYAPRTTHHTLRITFYVLLLTLLLFDQFSAPLPLTDARIPQVYEQIGAEPDEFSLMQLPLGWRNSYGALGAEQTQLQYYQSAHHRPILGGNTSRNPAFKFDYYANIPLFSAITEAELYQTVDETTLERARQQAAELMTLYNIKYLVIHDPIPFRKPYEDTFLATRKLTLDLIPHRLPPVYQSPGVHAIAVEQADIPNPLAIDFGHWTGDPYRGEGWASNEDIFVATANWAIASEAMIFFPVRGGGDRQLSIQIAPFSYPNMPAQQLRFVLNNHPLGEIFTLPEGWQTIELPLPEGQLLQGLNRLGLNFAQTIRPRQALPANKMVGTTGVETPVDLEVNSSGEFAFITVDFGEAAVDASAHRRGLNLGVVQPQSGKVITGKGFDTAANEYEAIALSRFIADIPEGYIVIVATQGTDAATFLNGDALAALQMLGISTEAISPPFSAIGVKGASVGTALQTSSPEAAYLRLGASPDTRPLAAAVDKVIISQSGPTRQ